jgi:ComF family protein
MKESGIGGRLREAAIDLIMPPLCLSCGSRTAEPRRLCAPCWSQLSFIERPRCPMWGEPFAFDAGPATLSARALTTPPAWATLTAAVAFNDQAARLVHALKYHDRLEAASLMARLMYRAARDCLEEGEMLVSVPLHWLRLWRRRYNQAALLAQALAGMSDRQHFPQALKRHRGTRSQVGLQGKEREANVRGAFSVAETAKIQVAGKRIILIDDVLTTGATAGAAARSLLKAGARQVDVVVFALVLLPGHGHI